MGHRPGRAVVTLADLCRRAVSNRVAKGFNTPSDLNTPEQRDSMLGKLMLVVTEVAEAAEAVRHKNFENFSEELADVCIRIFDIAGSCHIDLEHAVTMKMKVNEARPRLHGKECGL